MSPDSSFADLVQRTQQGDPEACRRVFELYFARLIGLVRSRLDPRILAVDGPEDVAQSVLKSFFLRHRQAPFTLANWDNLWGLLAFITLRKCGHRTEHYRAQCRDVARQTPLDRPGDDTDSASSWLALTREPDPAEAAVMEATIGELLSDLSEYERSVMQLALEEHSLAEIARRVKTTEYRAKKVLEKVRRRWEGMG
jgi:DNA-directed RNA polymerase specialized sigma24 family protein